MWSRGSNPTSPFPLFPPGTTTLPRCPHHLEVLFSFSRVRFSLVSPLVLAAALYLLRLIPKVVTHPPIDYHEFGNSSSFLVASPSDANFCATRFPSRSRIVDQSYGSSVRSVSLVRSCNLFRSISKEKLFKKHQSSSSFLFLFSRNFRSFRKLKQFCDIFSCSSFWISSILNFEWSLYKSD